MIKKAIAFIFLASFLYILPIFSQVYENQLIKNIEVIIVNSLDPISDSSSDSRYDRSALLSRLCTKKNSLFSQVQFDTDLKTLIQEFDRVEPVLELDENNRLNIILKVWLRPYIRKIYWHGNRKLSARKLQSELGICPGVLFDRLAFNQAFHKLKTYYIKKGYFEATLEYSTIPDPNGRDVDIEINICEGRSGRIRDIAFFNFTPCEQNDVLELMVTKKFNMFTSWMTQEGTYNEDAIQQDQFIILNYLQNQGYADATVDIEICETNECGQIVVVIKANKGERYRFGQVTFEGNCVFDDCKIANLLLVKQGCPFSPDLIRENTRLITDAYGKCGYIDAVINYETRLSENDDSIYNVHFKIEEGEQFRVGLIKVFGNISTQTSVILHETLLIPGDIFNIIKLQATETKLLNIGFFKCVNVYAVKSDESCILGGNYRDVYIEVEETTTGNFGASLGYSTVESIFGGINLTENNFNYKGFCRLRTAGLCALRGGGEHLYLGATIGAKSSSYVLSWVKPFFEDTPWTIGFDLFNTTNRYISHDYDVITTGINVHAHYNIDQFWRLGYHYRLKYGRIRTGGDVSPELRKEAKLNGLISAAGGSLTYDSRNNPVHPDSGFLSIMQFEYAGLGGDHRFASFGYLNTYYYPVTCKSYFKLRGDLQFIVPCFSTRYETIPIDERLFLGDTHTVRGYRPYKLGPKYYPGGDPRGGLSLQYYSIEYDYLVHPCAEAFLFVDSGQLSKHEWSFGRFNVSAGFGVTLNVISAVPPITLGMGYPINPKNRGDVKRFFLAVGGRF